MDMNLEALVILADNEAVANAVEVSTQRLEGLGLAALADDKDGIEGEGDLLVQHGEVGLLLALLGIHHLGDLLTAQGAEHTLKDHQIALTTGIHHAGLLQHGVHLDGLSQRLITCADGLFQHELGAVILLGCLDGALGSQTGHGQHRTLGGLHDSAVSGGDALVHRVSQCNTVRLGHALEHLGHAAEQQGQNDAGVTAGTTQQAAGSNLGGLLHGGGLMLLQLGYRRLNGQGHIGTRVAIGDREHVQIINGLLLIGDAGGTKQHHLLEGAAVDSLYHFLCAPPQALLTESTQTFTSRTSTPVLQVTTYFTSLIMARQTVAIFTPGSTMMCSSMDTVLSEL